MKTAKALKLVVPALLLVSGSALAGVVGSSHDLSNANNVAIGNAADQGQVCVYCHTPHKSLGNTNGPLWNHNEGGVVSTYTMYTSGTFEGSATIGTAPGAESLACLSCHDGTVALDSISNVPGLNATWTEGAPNMTGTALVGTVLVANLDLSNDHPIAFTYDNALVVLDPGLAAPAAAEAAGIELFAGKLECATCHDVHDDTFNAFLRVTDSGSAICTTCHLK